MTTNASHVADVPHQAVPQVQLRAVEDRDCELLWEWANDAAVRASAFSGKPISWDAHTTWFRRKQADAACVMYLVLDADGCPVGQVRFDLKSEDCAEVDVSITRASRRRGCGTAALRLACRRLGKELPIRRVVAIVKSENTASLRAFKRAGFVQTEQRQRSGARAVVLERSV